MIMKVMRTLHLLAIAIALFAVGCTKPTDDHGREDEEPLKPNQRKVSELIAKAGKLPVSEPKEESKSTADTLPGIIPNYQDPYYSISTDSYDARCVETTTEYDVVNNPDDFVTLDPWSDIYPGALIQGESLAKGIPSIISIYSKRKPGRIYMSMINGDDMDEKYKEAEMRGSEVIKAQNELLAEHFAGEARTAARTSFEIVNVSSIEEMALKLGINLKLFGARLNTELGNGWKKERSYVAVKLFQTFFTMAYEAPDGGFTGVFTDKIQPQDLEPYTGFGNPICYVSSVSYGRMFMMLYESSCSQQELEMAINVGYRKTFDSNLELKSKKVLNESRCKMIQIGGNAEAGLATVFGDFDKLREFIINGAEVSPRNVGAPISYHIKYLRDNTDAKLSNTLKYKVTTKQYYPVKPQNKINIDFLKLKVSRIRPLSKRYHVSTNYTYAKLKSIHILSEQTGDNKQPVVLYDRDMRGININNQIKNGYGIDVPLNSYYNWPKHNIGDRITITGTVEVHNRIYHGGYKQETRDVVLQRTFVCNNKGQWESLEDIKPAKDAFTSIKKTEIIASAEVDLDLQIRFSQDGVVLGRD